MNILHDVVEEIGQLNDRAETDRWVLAEAISDAYDEFPAYTRGLTDGLCQRLRRSTDLIYSLRDAWRLKAQLKLETSLSVTHFAALFRAKNRYDLPDAILIEWVLHAENCDLSVEKMNAEIAAAYIPNQSKHFYDRLERVERLVRTLWQDSEAAGAPQPLRKYLQSTWKKIARWLTDRKETPPD